MSSYNVYIEEVRDSIDNLGVYDAYLELQDRNSDDKFEVVLTLVDYQKLGIEQKPKWCLRASDRDWDSCLIENLIAQFEAHNDHHGFFCDRYHTDYQPFAVGI